MQPTITNAAREIALRQVLPEAELAGPGELHVKGCSSDVHQMASGDLFVALPGTDARWADDLAEAIARGCAAIVAERPVADARVPVCYVADAREAYGRICHALAGNPCEKVKTIGVTGTRGKTTTVHLIASVLSAGGLSPGLVSTLGCFDGEEYRSFPADAFAPKPLAGTLSRMVDGGCSHAVLEIPARALDESAIAGMSLDAACVTNIQRESFDGFRGIQDYRVTKSRILGYLAGEGFAVLNADDSASATFIHQLGLPVLTTGIRATAEVNGVLLDRCRSEQTFLLTAGSEAVPVRTRLIGSQHVYNCLTAAAVGLAYGIDLAAVARGLESVEKLPRRMERLECGQPFGVFVDAAGTPEALSLCLQTLREVTDGRMICVIGAEGHRDERPELARAAEADADVVVLTAASRRNETATSALSDLLEGLHRPEEAQVIADRTGAIYWALSQARPADCVVIAGQPDRTEAEADDPRAPRDDSEIAREWLYRVQPHSPSLTQ
jgi:UDP-N-acetylmuramoyl-L-alanyl-D-glutamate--2,6-diaminopimelate ligase